MPTPSASTRRPAGAHRMSWRMPAALIPPTIAGIPAQAVSVPVAAAMLGISDRSIRRMIDSGDLPARKLPTGALSIRIADLDAVGERVGPRRA
ncbi:helix-turn-helix domain-containing protein [Tsukamurella tyrosinosolvens]|uniref:helix-turn-helix domain-containing protein n=1 Tax=Tsukamurella tyrosinosolvens TaxID=57704 RepID=UPI0036C8C5CB